MIAEMAMGETHALILLNNTIFEYNLCNNNYRLVYFGTSFQAPKLIACGKNIALFVTYDNRIWYRERGGEFRLFVRAFQSLKGVQFDILSVSKDITAITAGDDHIAVVIDNKQIFCYGRNHHGQLGRGIAKEQRPDFFREFDYKNLSEPPSKISKLIASNNYTLALCSGGMAFAWGKIPGCESDIEVKKIPTTLKARFTCQTNDYKFAAASNEKFSLVSRAMLANNKMTCLQVALVGKHLVTIERDNATKQKFLKVQRDDEQSHVLKIDETNGIAMVTNDNCILLLDKMGRLFRYDLNLKETHSCRQFPLPFRPSVNVSDAISNAML